LALSPLRKKGVSINGVLSQTICVCQERDKVTEGLDFGLVLGLQRHAFFDVVADNFHAVLSSKRSTRQSPSSGQSWLGVLCFVVTWAHYGCALRKWRLTVHWAGYLMDEQ
jgi:hypothetical protein